MNVENNARLLNTLDILPTAVGLGYLLVPFTTSTIPAKQPE
jgi:hypothetical protein